MSDHAIDDPMEFHNAMDDVDVGDPRVEGAGSVAIDEDSIFLEDREMTPVPEDAQANHNRSNEASAHVYDMDDADGNRQKEDGQLEENDKPYDLVVDSTPFDVEVLTGSYASHALIVRLEFLIEHCPPLRREASIALIGCLRNSTHNVQRYSQLFKDLETNAQEDEPMGSLAKPHCDKLWMDETMATSMSRLDYLLAEYKKQKDEGVKESTRRAMEELFQHYMSTGHVGDALRLYARGIRDYCTQFKHSINMWINWIEASIMAEDMSKVESLAAQALRTLSDSEEAEKNSTRARNTPSFNDRRPTGMQSNRQLIDWATAKVGASQAIVKIWYGKYRAAAECILETNIDHLEPSWFVSPADLGIYATLCSIATFTRAELKRKVINEGTFRKLLESEPIFFELLQTFIKSQFGRCFDIMRNVHERLLLDPFLSRHVDYLFTLIRQTAVVQYLAPFSSVRIQSMASVIRCTVPLLDEMLTELVEDGVISLRIDRLKGTIHIVHHDDQQSNYRKIIEKCDELIHTSKVIMWKATAAQAGVLVTQDKESRNKRKPQGTTSDEAPDLSRAGSSNKSQNRSVPVPSSNRRTTSPAEQSSSTSGDVASSSMTDTVHLEPYPVQRPQVQQENNQEAASLQGSEEVVEMSSEQLVDEPTI